MRRSGKHQADLKPTTSKHAYHPPRLEKLGLVVDLTTGGSAGNPEQHLHQGHKDRP